ncbi:MAG: sigma-54 interaction domain-containing protein [Desulfobacterales bacterium]
MKRQDFPQQFADGSSSAITVLDDGKIVYVNNAFEKLYKFFNDSVREKFCRELQDLKSDLQKSGQTFTKKRLTLSPIDKEIDAAVYLLNKSKSRESRLLVLIEQTDPKGIIPYSIPDKHIAAFKKAKNESVHKLPPAFSGLIGEDPLFKAVLLMAQKSAKSDYPVLISGESGTGKEILARTIHRTSRRSKKKFVDINCAAIPDQLIDSELFGYEKGAFTGAVPGGRHGLFVEAHQGTLFFDEIAEASPQTQAKLLRVLTEGCFKRIGGMKNIDVDVRIISATNKDLSQLIDEKRFREDLIYRLNTISIHLPPLRERPGDISLLARFFLKQHATQHHRKLEFSSSCFKTLESYHWPGNVRELKGVVDYTVTMATGSRITADYFPDFLLSKDGKSHHGNEDRLNDFKTDPDGGLLATVVHQTEKEVIKEVLQRAKNRSEAIKILGISRRTFYTKIKQYGLQ